MHAKVRSFWVLLSLKQVECSINEAHFWLWLNSENVSLWDGFFVIKDQGQPALELHSEARTTAKANLFLAVLLTFLNCFGSVLSWFKDARYFFDWFFFLHYVRTLLLLNGALLHPDCALHRTNEELCVSYLAICFLRLIFVTIMYA